MQKIRPGLGEVWAQSSASISEAKYPPPVSIRFSDRQKALLKSEAKGAPLGQYVRSRLFGNDGSLKPHKVRPVRDPEALAQLLAKLGQSQLPNNFNQLTKLAHSGALPVTPETCKQLSQACEEIAEIRSLLIQALGMRKST